MQGGKRGRERNGRRLDALSRASQVDSGENSRDTMKPEQLPFQAGDNVR
jgi:hypothetical protein